MDSHDLIIVGGGPAGLAAALAARQAELDYAVFEKGLLVDSIYRFPTYMVFFTTAELLEIGNLPFVSPNEKPTRLEALRYYRRVVDTYQLEIELGQEVTSVQRDEGPGGLAFVVETRSARGVRRVRHARAVVLAIGYYDTPNCLGAAGEDLPHVAHYYREPHPYYHRRVVIVGGGNSAAEAALDLYRNGALVTIVHWHAALKDTIKYWVKPDIENRIKEGSIAARFNARVLEILPTAVVIEQEGERQELAADGVLLLTGYHVDTRLLVEIGALVDARTGAPAYDPETFETTVPGLFVAGGAISGKDTAPIFIENGRFHGEKIVKELVRRWSK